MPSHAGTGHGARRTCKTSDARGRWRTWLQDSGQAGGSGDPCLTRRGSCNSVFCSVSSRRLQGVGLLSSSLQPPQPRSSPRKSLLQSEGLTTAGHFTIFTPSPVFLSNPHHAFSLLHFHITSLSLAPIPFPHSPLFRLACVLPTAQAPPARRSIDRISPCALRSSHVRPSSSLRQAREPTHRSFPLPIIQSRSHFGFSDTMSVELDPSELSFKSASARRVCRGRWPGAPKPTGRRDLLDP